MLTHFLLKFPNFKYFVLTYVHINIFVKFVSDKSIFTNCYIYRLKG